MIILLMNGKGLYALVLVNAFVGIVVIAIKLWYLKRNVPIKIEWTYWNKSMLKEIFGFSIWIAIIVIAQNLIYNIMPTILGIIQIHSGIYNRRICIYIFLCDQWYVYATDGENDS